MNTTTNTYKATQEMMDSFDDNYVAYLGQNPFSMLVLISDGEHRDTYRRNKVSSSSSTLNRPARDVIVVSRSRFFPSLFLEI